MKWYTSCWWVGWLLVMLTAGCKQPALPAMHLSTTDTIGVETPVPVRMEYTSGKEHWASTGTIQRRGGMSLKYEKHSYKIELDKKTGLAGLPEDDDWIIHASAIDKTFLRNTISYTWFREMSELNRAPAFRYMELYLNGDYRGLYILMEQLESTRLGLHKKDSTACIFKDPPVFRSDTIEPQDAGNYYQQTYPDGGNAYGTALMTQIRTRLLAAPDSSFSAWSKALFDWNNIADWQILLLLTNNGDGVLKNFYLYRQDASAPLRVAPWDYDHSFGRDGDYEYNMLATVVEPERNLLIKNLMYLPEYRQLLAARWKALRASGIISNEHFIGLIDAQYHLLQSATAANSALWPDNSWWYFDDNNFEQEVDIMKQFMELRIPQLDTWMADL